MYVFYASKQHRAAVEVAADTTYITPCFAPFKWRLLHLTYIPKRRLPVVARTDDLDTSRQNQ